MFVRLVYESFRRQKRRKLLAGAAITLGVTVATAMIAVATDIGDKINRELRTIGANLLVIASVATAGHACFPARMEWLENVISANLLVIRPPAGESI